MHPQSPSMDLSFLSQSGKHLSEPDPAVIWRHALMPIWTKPFLSQPHHATFAQVTVLKAPAREDNAFFPAFLRDRNDPFD